MPGLNDLSRAYEARHFPPTRRLDLHGEGPQAARERALQWIQSRAHERPGEELLLIVERGRRAGGHKGPVRQAVEKLLQQLTGGLLEWWQPFGPGSLAVRVAADPRLLPRPAPTPRPAQGEGRTPETAGAGLLAPDDDIPEELLPLAQRIAELRREREALSVGLLEVMLRRVWIEAQAIAMAERVGWETALQRLLREEQARLLEE